MATTYMMIIAIVLLVNSVLNLVFAFRTPPPFLDAMLNGFGRRVRALLTFVPEAHRIKVGRIIVGITGLLGVAMCVGWLATRGF